MSDGAGLSNNLHVYIDLFISVFISFLSVPPFSGVFLRLWHVFPHIFSPRPKIKYEKQ